MFSSLMFFNVVLFAQWEAVGAWWLYLAVAVGVLFVLWLGFRYIPNNAVGVVEKLWSPTGSVPEGQIVALEGEAGYQVELLRGGMHFGYWRWQYRVHKVRLVTISQGKIGYVYARDGEPLPPSQTLGQHVECNNFQDARSFLIGRVDADGLATRGQRGRQRDILREGVYAINPALFVVISEDHVFALPSIQARSELHTIEEYRRVLAEIGGFNPIVIGHKVAAAEPHEIDQPSLVDSIGIVTVHDGPSLPPDEIIAPIVGSTADGASLHNNFQDAEEFLHDGGRRGRQYQTLTDGTYFINRWFATLEMIPKTVVPIGYVGVVVSYIGRHGQDLSGRGFRHGEQVATGERGVWERPLGPGKYAFNTYAGAIILVPTTNFVLHWITGKSEAHRYDESLRSIDLVTRDAYEPLLPLSVVVHIDYERAPSVIQRFGDVKKLITQTLDPMLSAYFRDIAHTKTMLELLHQRDDIQHESRTELQQKFRAFDIECVDVLIGKPTNVEGDDKIETLLEQLRQRQLSNEQLETFERRKEAAKKLQELNAAQAQADMQTALTNAQVQARIAENQGEAELARARKQAEQTIVVAEASLGRSRREAEQKVVLAEADSRALMLAGRGESQRIMQEGLSQAAVLTRKINSFGDPRLFAINEVADKLAHSRQPLVPQRLFITAGGHDEANPQASGLIGTLLGLLVAEKSGFQAPQAAEPVALQSLVDQMSAQAVENMKQVLANGCEINPKA
jgi:uncharacterized membrane protein YqiK